MRARKMAAMMRDTDVVVWQGDFEQGKQTLLALRRNATRDGVLQSQVDRAKTAKERFLLQKEQQAQLVALQDRFLVQFDVGYNLSLSRSPKNVVEACEWAFDEPARVAEPFLISISQLLGVLGAYEQRLQGCPIRALGDKPIFPYYGVFPPTRQDYLELFVEQAEKHIKEPCEIAYDIGVGTGVLSAILLDRGFSKRVLATDVSSAAIKCAKDNFSRLGIDSLVDLYLCSLFPSPETGIKRADLIVFNPPWIPLEAHVISDHGVYDLDDASLRAFLNSAGKFLAPGGKIFLVISDLAERLELRPEGQLERWITECNLDILDKASKTPTHPKAVIRATDPLAKARQQELVHLYVLAPRVSEKR
jgi:hypothetical protein